MTKYKVIGMSAEFHSGKIELTKQQAAARTHNLKHLKGNIYEILKPVQFKKGETVGFGGEVSKVQLQEIEDIGKPKASKSGGSENLLYAEGEALELIAAAVTIAEVDEVIEGDTRQNVLDAAASKKAELKAELEKEAEDAK